MPPELSDLHHSVVISGFCMVKVFQFSSWMKAMASRGYSGPHQSTLVSRNSIRLVVSFRSYLSCSSLMGGSSRRKPGSRSGWR